jgi:hypothetical protein
MMLPGLAGLSGFDGTVPPAIVALATAAIVLIRQVYARHDRRRAAAVVAAGLVMVTIVTGALEQRMGRPLTYQHGPVRLWSGDIASDQNSQQLSDPYTFTHFTHGALFYAITRALMPSASVGLRALIAMGLEGSWEAYENTDTVIQRYRAVTISLGYYGDSVVNSISDIVACACGFLLAWRSPKWLTVSWMVAVEVVLALWIRDNLTLNLIMLIAPLDAIRRWQAGL